MKTFAGKPLAHPLVMGIVNATPDSFSDGGEAFAFSDALARAMGMLENGADIIDVGGESTRPGAAPVSSEDEIARTVPVIERLVGEGACVSIDTRHAEVMQAALDAGASIINDVSALSGEGAILKHREIMGATNPAEAAEGTIRKLFAENIERNSVHGSDAPETAAEEIKFFFTDAELVG